MALSDSDLAFEGLEDHLEEIRASDAHYITQWDWSQLRNLRKINTIDIHLISMYSIEQQFPSLESLQWLSISKAEISFIHPKAFRGLTHLKMLILKENEITEMSRKMLPNPAKELFLIDLRYLIDNFFSQYSNLSSF
ncbi:leucine-rich repeats and immunoglobulin-like domains protein 3 [Trichonephila clavata]|uniref:Leucine-rich repeats and immunoglobulin-like domains protein 3 n=1 Tax=Trichonephila clavata TaxID=2740835 RepID=A0A8X6J315_TRICU|nr:leucine-rich repeats and immunoglobulin-like domains protein 3 [Trichonephila clavata]